MTARPIRKHALLSQGVLDKVVVVIKEEDSDQALERFIFSLNTVVTVEIDQIDKP